MKRTAAVIVTYNRKAMLQRCLRALCTQTAGVPELWVIDNASTDGTAELVAQLNLPTMHYYNTGKNLGGAGGFACGIQQAACSGAEYLWIMDDDCLPEPDALQQLLQRMPNWTGSTAGFPPAHWRRTVKTSHEPAAQHAVQRFGKLCRAAAARGYGQLCFAVFAQQHSAALLACPLQNFLSGRTIGSIPAVSPAACRAM